MVHPTMSASRDSDSQVQEVEMPKRFVDFSADKSSSISVIEIGGKKQRVEEVSPPAPDRRHYVGFLP